MQTRGASGRIPVERTQANSDMWLINREGAYTYNPTNAEDHGLAFESDAEYLTRDVDGNVVAIRNGADAVCWLLPDYKAWLGGKLLARDESGALDLDDLSSFGDDLDQLDLAIPDAIPD